MDPKIQKLKGILVGNLRSSLTDAARKFVDANAELAAFIDRKMERSAELVVEHDQATPEQRSDIEKYMLVVNQSVADAASEALLRTGSALKDEVLAALKSVFLFALQNLPAILALIRR